ncbi:peptidylprolyl isomerase [Paraliomyxa miuraensis]|uniref:peptidylprolyl isomerase n=1 Tax=Paraliomyxa miuraensis TaxID=376150 RepID=UPI002257979C|nr:peptidylprolyl isomerase [Paraliomyxa miuraensis]MCX4241971.1 peptidylprolyl isomerase [Paraliomyxa miuraensis]
MATPSFPSPQQLVPGNGELRATFHTSLGDFTVRLLEAVAPNTVANFVGLATGSQAWTDPNTGAPGQGPLYRNVIFHRVISDFMIQGGDPTGTGRGKPGYTFGDECSPSARHSGPGILSMANAGPGTNGCQFFVTLRATPHLDGKHTVFGEVIDGMTVVGSIGKVPTDRGDRPVTPVTISSISVARI